MKSPETAFLEIIETIQENISQGNQKIDDNKRIFSNTFNFSRPLEHKTKYFCRDSEGVTYVFEGFIDLDSEFSLHYYFSNKRSYVSLDTRQSDVFQKMQLFSYKYTELLFKFYNIDEFVYNFVCNFT